MPRVAESTGPIKHGHLRAIPVRAHLRLIRCAECRKWTWNSHRCPRWPSRIAEQLACSSHRDAHRRKLAMHDSPQRRVQVPPARVGGTQRREIHEPHRSAAAVANANLIYKHLGLWRRCVDSRSSTLGLSQHGARASEQHLSPRLPRHKRTARNADIGVKRNALDGPRRVQRVVAAIEEVRPTFG